MANEAKIDSEKKLSELLGGVEKIFRCYSLFTVKFIFMVSMISNWNLSSRMMRCDDAAVLNMMNKRVCSINNVQLFLGIIQKKTNQLISSITATEQPCKVLAKKDRIPKFNVRESAKNNYNKQTHN